MHPSWYKKPREVLLEELEFQSEMVKALWDSDEKLIKNIHLRQTYRNYMKLIDRLTVMEDIPGFDESEEYDELLDESDKWWYKMSEVEILVARYDNLRHNVCLSPEEQWIGIDGWM